MRYVVNKWAGIEDRRHGALPDAPFSMSGPADVSGRLHPVLDTKPRATTE
jgi:hypothetical protein